MADNNTSYPLVEFEGLLNKPAINFRDFSVPPHGEIGILEDLQANILKHHKRNFACHIFIKFNKRMNPDKASDWISNLTITSAKDQLIQREEKDWKKEIQCFYLSRSGYRFLNILHLAPKKCSAFWKGLTNKITSTFDTAKSELFHTKTSTIQHDAILLIAHDDLKELSKKVTNAIRKINKFGTCKRQYGFLKGPKTDKRNEKKNLTEWFGFKDGISGPYFFSTTDKAIPHRNIPNLKSIITKDPGGQHKQSAGSYLVFLKMSQNYEAFDMLKKSIIDVIDKPKPKAPNYREELSEAYIIGRFTDGAPLTLQDDEINKRVKSNQHYDFDYKESLKDIDSNKRQDDALGSRCPYHTHIRKVNPRTEKTPYSDKTIHRRGMLYAEVNNNIEKLLSVKDKDRLEILKEDQTEVGILFLSFQSHIEKQFEFIVQKWMHRDSYLPNGRKSGKDILTAKVSNEDFHIPVKWNSSDKNNFKPIKKQNALSQLLGGDYFFAPSLSLIRRIKDENPLVLIVPGEKLPSKKPKVKNVDRDLNNGAMVIKQTLNTNGVPTPNRGNKKITFSNKKPQAAKIIKTPQVKKVERDPNTGAMIINKVKKKITFIRKNKI